MELVQKLISNVNVKTTGLVCCVMNLYAQRLVLMEFVSKEHVIAMMDLQVIDLIIIT